MTNLTSIIDQLKQERDRLDAAIAALGGTASGLRRGGKRRLSAEARARISAGMRARWAARKGLTKGTKQTRAGKKRSRTISAEGRARIAAAQRARWAKQKKAAAGAA